MRQHHDPRMEFIDKVESTESQDRERNLVGGILVTEVARINYGLKFSTANRVTVPPQASWTLQKTSGREGLRELAVDFLRIQSPWL